MCPEFPRRKPISEEDRTDWHVDQISDHGTKEQESHIDLRVAKHPSEQPGDGPEAPKEHQLSDEYPTAVNTSRRLGAEGLIALGGRKGHVASATDSILETSYGDPFFHRT